LMCGRCPPIPPVVDLVEAEWTRPCHMRHLDHDVAMIHGKPRAFRAERGRTLPIWRASAVS
jgi:hypothetical protein